MTTRVNLKVCFYIIIKKIIEILFIIIIHSFIFSNFSRIFTQHNTIVKIKFPMDTLPPSKMVLDTWKRTYSNEDTKTVALHTSGPTMTLKDTACGSASISTKLSSPTISKCVICVSEVICF